MNPEIEQKLNDMQKEIDDLREARDVVFAESLRKRVFQDIIEAGVIDTSLTGVNETTTVPTGGGNVSHAEEYDKRFRIVVDGIPYYIGLYNA